MLLIVDYGMGNLHSVIKAFGRIGAKAIVSAKKNDVQKADKLVLPGVGSFASGILNLKKYNLLETLNKRVLKDKIPILGICLGLQLFTEWGEEGNIEGLGWIKGKTVKFNFLSKNINLKIPHMGWNSIKIQKMNPFLQNMTFECSFYFAHSYHIICRNKQITMATTSYGYDFPAVVQKENIYGVQFHPEKSHQSGLLLLKNFVENI